MVAIQAEGLCRDFNGRRVVNGLTFEILEGEIFGFLGPNGAGKTTTIRLLTGQLSPTAGTARVAGFDVRQHSDGLKAHIGVVFEYQNLYGRMSGRENLSFFASLYGVERERVEEVLQVVGLANRASDPLKQYSNGMKQRLLIARGLLHRPRVLFLDEPTRGLDPSGALEIRRLVRELVDLGITTFLTTHYMEEADQLCDRVAFINEGRITAIGSPERLKALHGKPAVQVKLKDGRALSLQMEDPSTAHLLSDWIARDMILSLRSGEASLEEVFLLLTGRSLQQ
jgi:ABC-2 type transport system ATP-binding protein